MKNHSMGLFEFMRVYLTGTVDGKQKSGTIRAQPGTVKTSIPRFSTNIFPPSFQIAFLRLAT
jgi:hypothetical protein